MPTASARHFLLASLLLAWPLVSYGPPQKMRTLPYNSGSETSESDEPSASNSTAKNSASQPPASAQTPSNLPPGVTFSNTYTTTVSGPGLVRENTATQPDSGQSKPDVVVYAVEVDEFGNPIQPQQAPIQPAGEPEPTFSGEPELAIPDRSDDGQTPQEQSGGFLDFIFGSDEVVVEEPANGLPAADAIPYPDLSPVTRSPRLGELVSVNTEEKIGVLWLDSRYLAFYGDEVLLSRRADLEVTGVFAVTEVRDSKALGLDLLYGDPTPGEEIIMPGPAYQEYILELADSGAIALPKPK